MQVLSKDSTHHKFSYPRLMADNQRLQNHYPSKPRKPVLQVKDIPPKKRALQHIRSRTQEMKQSTRCFRVNNCYFRF